MSMANRVLAGVACGLAIALTAAASRAAESNEVKKSIAEQGVVAQSVALRTLAHKMMGHVNLASLALDSNLPEAARQHLASGRKLVAQLQREAPRVTSETQFKYGKLSYDFQNQARVYYVPVIDDVFLLSEYKETFHAFREADLEESDAAVVEVTISVDLREVDKALATAESRLAEKKVEEARAALRDVFKDAITDEELITAPVWAIHDNLVLARNLIREHHYGGARFALDRAREHLAELDKGNAKAADKADFKKMHDEMTQLSLRLKQEDPTLSESIDAKYQAWMGKVRQWFSMDLTYLPLPL